MNLQGFDDFLDMESSKPLRATPLAKLNSFDSYMLKSTCAETPMVILGTVATEATVKREKLLQSLTTLSSLHTRLRCRVADTEVSKQAATRTSNKQRAISSKQQNCVH
jgi:hypothetical protein